MDRYQQNPNYTRPQNQKVDEDCYRGAYRLDNTRGDEYDGLNQRNNFPDNRPISFNNPESDHRSNFSDYRGFNQDRENERGQRQFNGVDYEGNQGSRNWSPDERMNNNRNFNSLERQQYPNERYENQRFHQRPEQRRNNYENPNLNAPYQDRRRENAYRDDWNDRDRGNYHPQEPRFRNENDGNMAGSLSYGIPYDYRSEEGSQRRFDPMTGHVRDRGAQAPSREDFYW